jgi:hypothetical protein
MSIPGLLHRLLAAVGLDRWLLPRRPVTGLVAAVVSFDREDLSVASIDESDQRDIVSRLNATLANRADGKFDGADWSASRIQWFFFGKDAGALEAVMLEVLRAEPRCKGALLRVTSNGIAGPWRETRI